MISVRVNMTRFLKISVVFTLDTSQCSAFKNFFEITKLISFQTFKTFFSHFPEILFQFFFKPYDLNFHIYLTKLKSFDSKDAQRREI